MRSMQKFVGINNVQQPEEITGAELTEASNVDIDLAGRILRRDGYVRTNVVKHTNVWEADGFTLATRGEAGDLANVTDDVVLAAGLGHARVWYWNLPDGRTLYSNGTQQGIVSAGAATQWGVPVPVSLGVATDVAGQLHPGKYQVALTHVRLADGIEGPPAYSGAGAVDVVSGGISFSALPTLAGHKTKVYLTSHYSGERFLAGITTGSTFSFTGKNEALQIRCPTDLMQPPPLGKLVAFWRGRTLVAVGNALFASRPNGWEIFDLQRDFKQFSAPLTMVLPVDKGIWVGTEKELSFLAGETWDKLARIPKVDAGVVLGSGVPVLGAHLKYGDGFAEGNCMVCIADNWLVGGTSDGELVQLSVNRYRAEATEVAATFRLVGDIPQYMAVVQ